MSLTLYTGGGRTEDAILAAIERGSGADHAYLAITNARWYDPAASRWSNDWRHYAMAKKFKPPVPAAAVRRTITPSEQRALDKKAQRGKADPTKDEVYPPKDRKAKAKQLIKDVAGAFGLPEHIVTGDKPPTKKEEPKQPPKPPVALEQVPDIADILPGMIAEYQSLKSEEAIIKMRLDELGPEIVACLDAVGQRAVFTDEWQISRATNTNVQLSKEKLAELGVSAETIAAATVRTPTRPFAKLTLRGEKEE